MPGILDTTVAMAMTRDRLSATRLLSGRQSLVSPLVARPQRQPAAPARPGLKVCASAAPAEQQVKEAEGKDILGVYSQPTPLLEGEKKHTINVFVADESGLINRVTGVFARRGANIESLAVALNLDKALFTIVLNGTDSAVANLCKQVQKLVKVRQVSDMSGLETVDRELMLLKVRAEEGPQRTAVLQIAEVFRAHINDLGTDTIILTAVGDPGKLVALQRLLSQYGILELARTGRIALGRGQDMLMGGGWGDSVAYKKSLSNADAEEDSVEMAYDSGDQDGDVYAVGDSMGDFMGAEAMDIGITIDEMAGLHEPMEDGVNLHMMSIVVNDKPGVLNLVTGIFGRRGASITSLAVGPSVTEGGLLSQRSRISMVVPGTMSSISKLTKQLYKLVDVVEVTDLTGTPHVARELCLLKVRCSAKQLRDIETVASLFHAAIVDVSPNSVIVQIEGKQKKLQAFQEILMPYGILEVARTGRVALARSSGVDSTYLQRFSQGRLM